MAAYKRTNLITLHIIAWPSTVATLPQGWQICDGTNGTPDLRSRFARGAVAGQEAGTTGGSDTVTLDSTMIPSHNHGITDPTHTHAYNFANQQANGTGQTRPSAPQTTPATSSTAATITINNQGGGGSHENRPKFLQVIFIAKTSVR